MSIYSIYILYGGLSVRLQKYITNLETRFMILIEFSYFRVVRFQQGLVQREYMMRVCVNLAPPLQQKMNKIGLPQQRVTRQPIEHQNAPQQPNLL